VSCGISDFLLPEKVGLENNETVMLIVSFWGI